MGEPSHSAEVEVQVGVETAVDVMMQNLDQLAESVVGRVDSGDEVLEAVGSGGATVIPSVIVEPHGQEFPSLHESQKQKKKGRGRPPKGLVGSSAALAGLEVEARQPRAASQGVVVLLSEMKLKKKENIAKAKVQEFDAPGSVGGKALLLAQ
ncbi:hypothetical protein V6N11_022057 [Hibiscus sabdariffa]|uniref:Uncharacterized protein n=1 Tax=Hibiscus sabdariffa TaxID=183260 RepID=A0ABR2TI20_9ROSI